MVGGRNIDNRRLRERQLAKTKPQEPTNLQQKKTEDKTAAGNVYLVVVATATINQSIATDVHGTAAAGYKGFRVF